MAECRDNFDPLIQAINEKRLSGKMCGGRLFPVEKAQFPKTLTKVADHEYALRNKAKHQRVGTPVFPGAVFRGSLPT